MSSPTAAAAEELHPAVGREGPRVHPPRADRLPPRRAQGGAAGPGGERGARGRAVPEPPERLCVTAREGGGWGGGETPRDGGRGTDALPAVLSPADLFTAARFATLEEFELNFMVEENMRRATAVVNGEYYDEAAGERRFQAAAPPRPHLRTLWSALDLEQCHAAGRAIADACFISRAGGRRSSPGSPEAFRRRARAA